jgi:hypothetical protein
MYLIVSPLPMKPITSNIVRRESEKVVNEPHKPTPMNNLVRDEIPLANCSLLELLEFGGFKDVTFGTPARKRSRREPHH